MKKRTKKIKRELRESDLFEIALQKANYPRRVWDGGDDLSYRSNEEIASHQEFWQRLVEHLRYRNPDLQKRETKERPHWLRYAETHFKLILTKSDTREFWKKLLKV